MSKLICSTLLLFMCCSSGLAQGKKDVPILLKSFTVRSDDILNGIYNLGLTLESTFNPQEDTLAVRVCSNYPLSVALSMSKGEAFLATLKFEKIGIPKSRIYYLRWSNNCPASLNSYVATEYWLVPKDAELPEFIEAIQASSITAYELTRSDFVLHGERSEVRSPAIEKLTPQYYSEVINNVVKLLKENKTAVAVIQVPYYKYSPTFELSKRVVETQSYLKNSGVASYRIRIMRINAGGILAFSTKKPQYPDITVVVEN